MNRLFAAVLLAAACLTARAQEVSHVWVADNGDGTYKNPVLHADYSDPDVIRVGDDYWLTSSSFDCIPALQILHSTDLVNWEIVGAVRSYRPEGIQTLHGNGVWAPSIRYRDGLYYIFWGDPDKGIYMVSAENPRGDWSEPHLVAEGRGMIDPCPLWDDDGRAYLVHGWAGSRAGFKSILSAAEMSPDGKRLIGPEILVFDGHDHNPTVEGPKFYKRGRYYYIFAPAGGVKEGWQLVMRSSSPLGRYEWRKVLHQGDSPVHGPHQGAWVTDTASDGWFMHFEDRYAYGRVVHLQPLVWDKEGWCTIGIDSNGDGIGEPVASFRKPASRKPSQTKTPAESDSFDSRELGLQWQFFGTPERSWYMLSPEEFVRLNCIPCDDLYSAHNLMLQKIAAPAETVTAKVSFRAGTDGDRGGLIVFGRDYATIGFLRREGRTYVTQTICKGADKGATEQMTASEEVSATDDVHLRAEVGEGAVCRFSFSADGKTFRHIGESFKAREGVWTGAKIGLFAVTTGKTNDGGRLDVDRFDAEPYESHSTYSFGPAKK